MPREFFAAHSWDYEIVKPLVIAFLEDHKEGVQYPLTVSDTIIFDSIEGDHVARFGKNRLFHCISRVLKEYGFKRRSKRGRAWDREKIIGDTHTLPNLPFLEITDPTRISLNPKPSIYVNMKWDWNLGLETALGAGRITPGDEEVIREYIEEKVAKDHIGLSRKNNITSRLIIFKDYLPKPYKEMLLKDLYGATTKLMDDEKYTQNSKQSYIAAIKPFFIWLSNQGYSKINKVKIREIKTPAIDMHRTRPEELLTQEDILALVKAAANPRDRALVWVLYESGARVSELARITWEDLTFNDYGVTISIVASKPKKYRRDVYLVKAKDSLISWRNECQDPQGLIFEKLGKGKGEPLTISSVRKILWTLSQRAKIKKRVYPHLFRKSRITHLITQGAQESIIKKSMWGNLGTNMFETYVTLGGDDIQNEMLRLEGITKTEIKADVLSPRACIRCGTINGPTSDYCSRCGAGLTPEAEDRQEYLIRKVVAHLLKEQG